ncbi:hypothetical protein ACJTOJ_20490 [Geodermatophilus arenarius]
MQRVHRPVVRDGRRGREQRLGDHRAAERPVGRHAARRAAEPAGCGLRDVEQGDQPTGDRTPADRLCHARPRSARPTDREQ